MGETRKIMVPENPWSNKEFFVEWQHLPNYELARRFGGNESSWRKWRKKHKLHKDCPNTSGKEIEIESLTPEEQVEADTRMVKLQNEVRELRSKNKILMKSRLLNEAVLETARAVLPTLEPVHFPAVLKERTCKTVESAVLAWADWHADEVVDEEIMEGLNRYNPYVMTRRVETTVDSALSLIHHHHSGTYFDEMVVMDVGDGITGSLHEENKYTNAFPPFEALVAIADIKSRALLDLAANMPKVVFIGVPGNHWRYMKNLPWKLPTENSDWLIYRMMALRLAEQENIEIIVPRAWSAVIEVKGWGFSLNHGYTDAKGGFGGISWYSQQRADAKRTAIDQRLKRNVSYRVYGHIHNEAQIGRTVGGQIITVPSLKGGDEYAKEGIAGTYSDPGQMLWGVHAERGKTWTYNPLSVNGNDDKEECRYDAALPPMLREY